MSVIEETLNHVETEEEQQIYKDKPHMTRETWSGKLDFIFSTIGYAVGLANIWRFPYLCYRNGGAVFLIAYVVFLVMCGIPLVFLEIASGQFSGLSPLKIWNVSPLFEGIGFGMVIADAMCTTYYNVIIAWALYYLFNSFGKILPWVTCDNSWNTGECALTTYNDTHLNSTIGDRFSGDMSSMMNITQDVKRTSSAEEYWQHHVLKISSGIESMGHIRLELLGCLALAWVVVFLCLIRGIKSSGKFLLVYGMMNYEPVTYGSYTYPPWAIGLGWVYAMCAVLPIPLGIVVQIVKSDGPILKRIKYLTRPSVTWGPSTKRHHGPYVVCIQDDSHAVTEKGQEMKKLSNMLDKEML